MKKLRPKLSKIIVAMAVVLILLSTTVFSGPQQEFIDRVAPIAQKIIVPSCGFPSVTIAQGGQESGWGTSELSKYDNVFGRKCNHDPCVWILTPEYKNGKKVMEWHQFQVYNSLEDALIDYCDKLDKPWYKRDFSSPQAFILSIQKPYASDPNYAASVMAIIRKWDLEQYDRRE